MQLVITAIQEQLMLGGISANFVLMGFITPVLSRHPTLIGRVVGQSESTK